MTARRKWARSIPYHTVPLGTGSHPSPDFFNALVATTSAPRLAMDDASQEPITRLLAELRGGNRAALDELFPLVYSELRAIAARQRRGWRGDLTVNTTALVHEAYLKLVGQGQLVAGDRAHFFAVAATAMRHILCNYARDRRREKRGGHLQKFSLDELLAAPGQVTFSDEQAETLTALDDALRQLEQLDPRQGRIVECRFFGGLTIEDTAAALGTSPATVKREWALARARLYRAMQPQVEA
jgi:RNA polymerase sigma factor (TIGR02999 family)